MKNLSYPKIALAALTIIAICILAGAMIPGSPLKSLIGSISGGSGPDNVQNVPAITSTQNEDVSGSSIARLSDNSSVDSRYLTLSRALELSRFDGTVSSWLFDHKAWKLGKVQAGHMDINGIAYDWMITYLSGSDVMMVNIMGGKVSSINTYTSTSSVWLGMSPEGLRDSPEIMDNLLSYSNGFKVTGATAPFSFSLSPGNNATYLLKYTDLKDSSNDFQATFDARSGALLKNTYKGVIS